MAFKCKIGLHNWNGCKCLDCAKTRDEQHDWNDCKCSKCGLEKHNWNRYICLSCGTIDYLELLIRIYEIGKIGDIIINDSYFNKSTSIQQLSISELSKCNSEAQKQELIMTRYNYLITVVKQSFNNNATYPLLGIQETIKEIAQRHNKNNK